MGKYNLNEVVPFRAVTVGEILSEELKARRIKQKDFAVQSGVNVSVLNEILKGKRSVNPEYAIAFERVLGIPASDWLALQADYDLTVIKIKEKEMIAQYSNPEESSKYKEQLRSILLGFSDRIRIMAESL